MPLNPELLLEGGQVGEPVGLQAQLADPAAGSRVDLLGAGRDRERLQEHFGLFLGLGGEERARVEAECVHERPEVPLGLLDRLPIGRVPHRGLSGTLAGDPPEDLRSVGELQENRPLLGSLVDQAGRLLLARERQADRLEDGAFARPVGPGERHDLPCVVQLECLQPEHVFEPDLHDVKWPILLLRHVAAFR